MNNEPPLLAEAWVGGNLLRLAGGRMGRFRVRGARALWTSAGDKAPAAPGFALGADPRDPLVLPGVSATVLATRRVHVAPRSSPK